MRDEERAEQLCGADNCWSGCKRCAALVAAFKQVRLEERERVLKAVDECWSFDGYQIHTHTWHTKQDCLAAIRSAGASGE